MKPHLQPRTLRLHSLMARHDLTRTDVADLLGCKPKIVSCWRCESPHPIPEYQIDRLELKLEINRLKTRLQYLEARIEPQRVATGVHHA